MSSVPLPWCTSKSTSATCSGRSPPRMVSRISAIASARDEAVGWTVEEASARGGASIAAVWSVMSGSLVYLI